MQTQLILFGFE